MKVNAGYLTESNAGYKDERGAVSTLFNTMLQVADKEVNEGVYTYNHENPNKIQGKTLDYYIFKDSNKISVFFLDEKANKDINSSGLLEQIVVRYKKIEEEQGKIIIEFEDMNTKYYEREFMISYTEEKTELKTMFLGELTPDGTLNIMLPAQIVDIWRAEVREVLETAGNLL